MLAMAMIHPIDAPFPVNRRMLIDYLSRRSPFKKKKFPLQEKRYNEVKHQAKKKMVKTATRNLGKFRKKYRKSSPHVWLISFENRNQRN